MCNFIVVNITGLDRVWICTLCTGGGGLDVDFSVSLPTIFRVSNFLAGIRTQDWVHGTRLYRDGCSRPFWITGEGAERAGSFLSLSTLFLAISGIILTPFGLWFIYYWNPFVARFKTFVFIWRCNGVCQVDNHFERKRCQQQTWSNT